MNSNIRILTWFNFFTDFKLYAPVAVIYFAQVSGSYALAMSVFSVASVSSAFFEIPTGVFSDRIGRKKTMVLGALSAVLYSIFYALGHSYLFLAIGAIFDGLSQAFYSGNNEAFLYDTLGEKGKTDDYAEFLGKTSKMFQIALAISAVLGAVLVIKWALPILVWLSVIPQIICFALSIFLREPNFQSRKTGNIYDHLKDSYLNIIKNRKLKLLSISTILGGAFGEASYQFQAAFYNIVWPLWAIPFAKVLSNLGAAISFHYSGKIIRKYNVIKIIIAGNIYNRVVYIFAAAFPSIFSPLLMTTSSIPYGIVQVGRESLMQKEFTNEQRATMGSLNSFATSIVFAIAAFSLGFLADKISPAAAIIALSVIQSFNLIFFWKLYKLHN